MSVDLTEFYIMSKKYLANEITPAKWREFLRSWNK